MCTLGKTPVILKKEIPGYLANRLSAALWREAIDLVDTGVASAEDVIQTFAKRLDTGVTVYIKTT
jgi:3-hydroxyacyl-CoA dehydrogenase